MANNRGGLSAREFAAAKKGVAVDYSKSAKQQGYRPIQPAKIVLPKSIAKQTPAAKIMSAQKSQFQTLPGGAFGPVIPKSFVKPAPSLFPKLDAVKSYTAPKFDYSTAKSVPKLDRSVADPLSPTDEEMKQYTKKSREAVLNPDNYDPVKHSSRSVFTQAERNASKPTLKEQATSRLRSLAEIPVGLRTLTGTIASKTASFFGKNALAERIAKNYEKANKDTVGQFAVPKTAGEEQAMAEFDSMSGLAVPARSGQISAGVGRIINRAGKAGVSPTGISRIMAEGEKGAFQSVPKMASNRFGLPVARAEEIASTPKIASEIPLAERVTKQIDSTAPTIATAPVREAIASGETVEQVAQKIPRIPAKDTRTANEIFTEIPEHGDEKVFMNVDDGGTELKKVEIGSVDAEGKFVEHMSEDGRPMTTVVEEGIKNLKDGKHGTVKMGSTGGNLANVRMAEKKKGLLPLGGMQRKMSAARDRNIAKIAEDANIQDHLKTKIEKLKAARDAASDPETRLRLEQRLNDEISILNDYPKMDSIDRQVIKERSLQENPALGDAIVRDYQDARDIPKIGLLKKGVAVEDPLLQKARKYKTTLNLQDKNDIEQLKRIFGEGTARDILSGKKTNWRGTSYEDLGRVNIISETPKTIEQQLAGKIKEVKLNSDTFYHGTSAENAKDIIENGFKTGASMPEDTFRGGGYGKMQNSVSLTETPKDASRFSTLTKNGEIVEAKLKPNSKVVSIQGVEDAVELEDYIEYLKKEKVDAVYIGGGEKELVLINTKAITPTKSQLTDLWNKAHGETKKSGIFRGTLKGFVGGDAPKTGFDPKSYVQEMVRKQKDAQGKQGLLSKVGSFLGEFKKKMIETNAPIEDVIAQAQKKYQFEARPRYDMTNQIDRVYRAQSMAGQFAKENGLGGVIKKVDDLDTFDQYLIAKHGQSLEKQGIKTGRDSVRDQQLIKAVGNKYADAEKVVRDYSHKLLDYAVESDLISKKVAEDLKVKYPDYVPYQRIFGEDEAVGGGVGRSGVANLGKQTVVQRIKGSEREVQSPMQSFLEKTTDAFVQGEKNKAAQILTSFHNLPDNPFGLEPIRTAENVGKRIELLTELKKVYRGTRDEAGKVVDLSMRGAKRGLMVANAHIRRIEMHIRQVNRSIEPILDEAIARSADFDPKSKIDPLISKLRTLENRQTNLTQKAFYGSDAERSKKMEEIIAGKKSVISELKNELSSVRDIPKSPGDNTISVFKDGVKEVWKVNKDVANAAKAMNVQQIGLLGNIFAVPVRIARFGITVINLPFIARNVAKDVVSAFVNSKESFRGLINMPRALFEAVGHQKLYQEMVREGAMQTSFDIARNQVSPTIRNAKGLLGNKGMERVKYIADTPAKLFRAVEDIVGRSEELNRISQYKAAYDAALKRGMQPIDARSVASRAARETTTNFARKGEWGSAMNVLVLYLNAGIQGSRTLTRNIIQRPGATSTKIISTVAMPLAITTAWNLKDPERKAAYEDIPEFEKENNFILIPEHPTQDENGKWNVIKVPITPGLSNMVQPVRYALERANNIDPQSFAEIANVLSGSVSPIQIPVDTDTTRKTISQLTPQAIKPSIEAVTNKDSFTGAPIIPRSLEGLAPELQVKDNTSGTAMILGKQLNASPLQIEHFIKSTFGSVGLQVLNASDRVLAKTGKISPEDIGGQDVFDAVTASFSKASGGAIKQKQWANEATAAEADKSQKYIEKQKFQPTFDNIQKLIQEGKDAEANQAIDNLSDDEVKQFNKMVTAEKKKTTEESKRKMQPVADELSRMMKDGDEAGVNRIIDGLTDEEVHALGLVLGIKL